MCFFSKYIYYIYYNTYIIYIYIICIYIYVYVYICHYKFGIQNAVLRVSKRKNSKSFFYIICIIIYVYYIYVYIYIHYTYIYILHLLLRFEHSVCFLANILFPYLFIMLTALGLNWALFGFTNTIRQLCSTDIDSKLRFFE